MIGHGATAGPDRAWREPAALARQLFQIGKRRVERASTRLAGVFDDAVEPAVDKEHGALTLLAVGAVGFPRGKAQAADIALPAPDHPLHRLRHQPVMNRCRIVQVGLHERQDFAAIVVRIGLIGDAAVVRVADAPAVIAAGAGRKQDRQQQKCRMLRKFPQDGEPDDCPRGETSDSLSKLEFASPSPVNAGPPPLGEAMAKALADKRGMERYGFTLPMDDADAQVLMDFGGRSWIVWNVHFLREKIGDMPTEMFFHFFKSFSDSAKCNLNIKAEGENEHHKIEAIFKAFAKAIKIAIKRDVNNMVLPSTKGVL